MRAMRKFILRVNLFIFLLFMVNNVTAGGIVVGGTRIIYEGNKKRRHWALKITALRAPFYCKRGWITETGKRAALLWSHRRYFVSSL